MDYLEINLEPGEKVYFASDFHLGVHNLAESQERERKLSRWLDSIKSDAHSVILLGDVFDFWFEYKKVVPKGFVRFIGKLAELSDSGVNILLFQGNHDMWMFDYFKTELNASIYKNVLKLNIDNTSMLVGHGDGLGPGDRGYKVLRKIFRNPLCQFLFGVLPPAIGIGIAQKWSRNSRISSTHNEDGFHRETEHLISYCERIESEEHHDFYIFGHRHLVIDEPVGKSSRYINLGEWVNDSRYAIYSEGRIELKKWEG